MLHFSQLNKYTTPVVLQFKSPFSLKVSFVFVDLKSFLGSTCVDSSNYVARIDGSLVVPQ